MSQQEESTRKERVARIHLFELMKYCVLELPSPPSLETSPEYEARMSRLRLLAAEAEYQKMTQNVSGQAVKQENIGQELRKMDSQVTFMFNFVLTVVGAFAFGYKAVEYSLDTPNLSLQLTVAVTLATLVFFADIYFIIKDYV
ncbi:TMEM199 [Bugula neritina]|uniref:TMEM199 n=1 Tax=Bugula neritina TaxID=10212 RepID=A0A7J7JE64_BUGNE|nr:TMEM199 [Bugula neritina]